jgi:hypothetical protein
MVINTGIKLLTGGYWADEISGVNSGFNVVLMPITVLLCIQSLDLMTTRLVLDNGGAEINPCFSIFQGTVWFWPLMILIKVFFLAWTYYLFTRSIKHHPQATRATYLVILIMGIVVVINNILALFLIR